MKEGNWLHKEVVVSKAFGPFENGMRGKVTADLIEPDDVFAVWFENPIVVEDNSQNWIRMCQEHKQYFTINSNNKIDDRNE